MKQRYSFLLLFLSAGLLLGCQHIAPPTTPNPIVGNWILQGFDEYHLPAWFVAKASVPYKLTSADTNYSDQPLAILNNVNSFTFAQDNTVSELYPVMDFTTGVAKGKIDMGSWNLADSVVHLSVVNAFPHKLTYTYKYATDVLVTDAFTQTAVVSLTGAPTDTVRVSYTIRLYYRRGS